MAPKMRKAQLVAAVWLALVRQLAMLAAVTALRHQAGLAASEAMVTWLGSALAEAPLLLIAAVALALA